MKPIRVKGIAYLLAIVMAISFVSLPVFTEVQALLEDFRDVPKTAWYYDYVMFLAGRSIVSGYGNSGEFRPQNPVIREHSAKMVARGAGLDYEGKQASFPDVEAGEMSSYIAALVESGAVGGYPDGTFRPTLPIKRGHAAKIIQGAFGLEMSTMEVQLVDLPSQDPGVSHAIQILASNGIVKGYSGSHQFKPDAGINRAEFAKILCLSMIVSAVQELEAQPTPEAFSKTQNLVNRLSDSQDGDTKAFLQARLDAVDDSVKTLTVIFKNYDGTVLKIQNVTYGSAATAPPTVPARTGYTFKGWDLAFSYVTDHLTVTAQWEGNEHKVTFNANGGQTPDPPNKMVIFGDPYGDLATVKHAGVGGKAYGFEGWWLSSSGLGSQILETTAVTVDGNHTIYAKWTEVFNITRTNENSISWNRLVITRHQGSVYLSLADAFIRRTEYGWADQGNFSLKIEGDWPVELYGLRFAREGSSPRSLRTLVVTGNGSPSGTFDVNLRVFISLKDNHDVSTFFTVRVQKAEGTPTPLIDIIALPKVE